MPFTPEQLAERARFLGASESAAAIGLSTFFTPLELYASKRGELPPIEETLPMMVGQALEPVTLTIFERETGMKANDRQQLIVDARNPWRRSTIDARADDGWLVEAKASGIWQNWGKDEDAVPAQIIYQCQHQLACDVDAPGVYVPVILGQREWRLYQVERDRELIEMLTRGEQTFMDYLAAGIPPDPITMEDLNLLYPVDVGKSVIATDYIREVAFKFAATKDARKRMEKQEESEAFEIKEFMKDAAILTDAYGNPLITWKANTERRMDVTAFRKDHPQTADAYSPEKTVRKLLCKIKL